MPTYEYLCRACGHSLELFQSMTEGPKRKCPACGQNKLKRLIGAGAGILFKGEGYYQTDYRSQSYKEAAAKDKPSSDSTSSTSKGQSNSKEASAAKTSDKTTS